MSKLFKIGLLLILIGTVTVIGVPLVTGSQLVSLDSEDNYTLVEKSYEIDDFNAFDFDFQNRNVVVYESDDEFVHLIYYLHEKDIVEYNDESTELSLSISRKWYDNFFLFNLGISREHFTVYLYLPSTIIDSQIDIKSSNGKITIDTTIQYESIKIISSNGDLVLKNLFSDSLKIYTSNGDMTLNNVNVTNTISGNTSNGKIILNHVVAKTIDLGTSNGRIEANNISAQDIELHSSNGQVYLSIIGNKDDYKIILSTSNGDKILDDLKISSGIVNSSKTNTIELKSSNGDVEVQFLNE